MYWYSNACSTFMQLAFTYYQKYFLFIYPFLGQLVTLSVGFYSLPLFILVLTFHCIWVLFLAPYQKRPSWYFANCLLSRISFSCMIQYICLHSKLLFSIFFVATSPMTEKNKHTPQWSRLLRRQVIIILLNIFDLFCGTFEDLPS